MRAFFKKIGTPVALVAAVLFVVWSAFAPFSTTVTVADRMAYAGPSSSLPGLSNYPVATGIAAETFAAERTTDTMEVPGGAYNLLVLKINYSASANVGDITMICYEGLITDPYVIQSVTVAAGVGTSRDASWLKAVTAAKKFPWRVDITGFQNVHCALDHSAGAAGDIFTVTGYFTTE